MLNYYMPSMLPITPMLELDNPLNLSMRCSSFALVHYLLPGKQVPDSNS